MGQSTDAYLFWGFSNDEDEEFSIDEEFEGDWETAYAAKNGIIEPSEECTENSPEWSKYWDKKRKLIDNCPAKLSTHCSGNYPIGFVCIASSHVVAKRGFPEEITSLEVGESWRSDLQAFCELMKIPWQEPKWWLASEWS